MRIIDADYLAADIKQRYCAECICRNILSCSVCFVSDMIDEIEECPTVKATAGKKAISICSECAAYSMKQHRCTRGAHIETDPAAPFYDDCPLPEAVPLACRKEKRE